MKTRISALAPISPWPVACGLWLSAGLWLSCAYKNKEADLVVHNARIITLDSVEHVYAAMAIKDGRIVELGAEQAIMNRYRAKETYDAAGQPVYPGFIDGHCHFLGYGLDRQQADLTGTSSFHEVVQRVVAFGKTHPDAEWIIGRGWDQNDWPVKEYPLNDTLNALFPDRPVVLQRIDGHAVLVNDAAMETLKVERSRQVEGGQRIERNGRFTGVLVDNAATPFEHLLIDGTPQMKRQALLDAQRDCLAAGLTMVCDAGLDAVDIDLIQQMQEEGALKIRIYAMVSDSRENMDHFTTTGPILTERLIARALKVYADGALGSRGALLKTPYDDGPAGYFGSLRDSIAHFREVARWCKANGFQMASHCIGDSANKVMLDIYGEALGGTNDLRWRIEHAQCMDPADWSLFANFNVIPSMQPTHLQSDAPWFIERIGPARAASAYAWKTALKQNGLIALGTDFPVEGISAIATYYAAISRKYRDGSPIPGTDTTQALTRIEALRGMTIWNAIATFTENDLGTLEMGKRADFTVLDRDILLISEPLVAKAKVVATFVGGEAMER